MNPLTCISVSPEYAYFIAAGRKTWETRSGPPSGDMRPDGVKPGIGGHKIMAGQRIGIAATAKIKGLNRKQTRTIGTYEVTNDTPHGDARDFQYLLRGETMGWPYRLPTAALIATAIVDYCVPIVASLDDVAPGSPAVAVGPFGPGALTLFTGGRGWECERLDDQLPYGYWNPGGWAWHLSDVTGVGVRCPLFCNPALTEPVCPACKGRGRMFGAYQLEGLPGTRQGAWALDFTVKRSLW